MDLFQVEQEVKVLIYLEVYNEDEVYHL